MALEDLILVVDENDKPISNASMREVRQKGLIHRIARVMVEDPSGRILLQKRAAKLLWPNCWDNSAAGHVDADEEYLEAAKRELMEEIDIRADELEELGTYFTDTKQGDNILKRFNRVYKFVTDDAPKNVSNEEVTEIKWFSVDEAKSMIKDQPGNVTDGLKDVLDRYY